jgi:branched-chain amino acid transport system substrate-binding protein
MAFRGAFRGGRVAVASLVVVVSLLTAACGEDSSSGTGSGGGGDGGDRPIKIGLSAAFSGQFAEVGPQLEAGINAWLDEHGDLAGHEVEIVIKDDKNDPNTAIQVANEAIDSDEVDVMIGPAQTGTAAATMQTYTNSEVPQLIIGTADSVIGEQFPYAYRVTYAAGQQADLLVPYLVDTLGKDKIGIMVVNDALGTSQQEAAVKALEDLGLEPAAVEQMNTGDTNVQAQLNRFKSAGVNGVFLYASGSDAAAVLKGMDAIGLDAPVVAHSGIALASFLDLVEGLDISEVYSTGHCPVTRPLNEKAEAFVEVIKEDLWDGGDFGQPISLQGLTYDAMGVIEKAVELGGGVSRAQIADGLSKITDYEGVMGRVDFSESNNGWPLENITVVPIDSWDPATGTYERAKGVACGAEG